MTWPEAVTSIIGSLCGAARRDGIVYGGPHSRIAKMFGTSEVNVFRIVHGKTWKEEVVNG